MKRTAASDALVECTLQSGCLSSQTGRVFTVGHLSADTSAPVDRWKTAIGCSGSESPANDVLAAKFVDVTVRGISPGSNAGTELFVVVPDDDAVLGRCSYKYLRAISLILV